nr:BamA/TamA family outer membrane protein [Nannocystis sp. ILAH1]
MHAPDARAGDRRSRRPAPSRWSCGPVWGLFAAGVLPWTAAAAGPAVPASAASTASPTASPSAGPAGPAAQERRSVTIAALEVRGTEQTPSARVLEILAAEGLRQGETLLWPEDARVQRARLRLLQTDAFERVTLRLRPLAGEPGSVTLTVDVEERISLEVTDLYLGTSRFTPFRGGIQALERNFLGRALHLGGGFVWGSLPRQVPRSRRQQAFRLHLAAPRLRGSRFGLAGTVYVTSASEPYRIAGRTDDPDPSLFRTVDYGRIGGILGTTFNAGNRLVFGLDYRFERVNAQLPVDPTYTSPIGESRSIDLELHSGVHRLTSFNFGLNYDGRDEAARFGKGARVALDLQLSSPLVGSEYEYIKLVAGGAYSFRLPWGHWITPSVVAGQIAGRAPRFERFFAGDLSDWTPGRELGLVYTTRSPVDVFNTGIDRRVLGSLFARLDLEYVWPLFQRNRVRGIKAGYLVWSTGIFTFAGDSAERALHRAAGEWAAPIGFNANFGLRLETVVGALEFSVGNVLRRTPL